MELKGSKTEENLKAAFAGESQQQTRQDIPRQPPRLVEMIDPKEHAVRDPIPLAKDALHLREQYTAEDEFFSQERVEYREHDLEYQQIPCADPKGP